MSLIICVEAPLLRLFLFTNHLSSRFLAGERHRQRCVFIHMGMRLQLVASWFLSLPAAEMDLFIPHHLERWSVMSLFFWSLLGPVEHSFVSLACQASSFRCSGQLGRNATTVRRNMRKRDRCENGNCPSVNIIIYIVSEVL